MKLKFLAFVVIILSNKLDVYGDSYKCQFESNGIEIHNQNLNGYSCKIELVSASSPNHINVNHIYGYDDDDVKFVSQPSFISEMDGLLQNLFTESCKKFTNLEGIQLRSSNVVKFNDESFEKCLNLKYLDFYNCNINEISEQSFSHQGGLKMLSLAKNRLSTLHESVFYNQRNLEFLTLWSNSISTLPPNIFSNLVNLQELGLGGNYIQNLNPLWFKNLRSMVKLSLISNQIQELPSNVFSSMKNLKELWMHNNKLQVIHSDSFGVLPKLTTVYFEQNSINGIDELFIDNTAISYISMWGNQCFQGALSRRNDLKSDLRSCFQNYQSKNSATTTTKMTTTTRKTTTRKIVTITRPTINIECEPGLGASVMYDLLYHKPQKLMLLAGCSTVCTTVAEAAKMWNLVVLCYGASSPALSDRSRFPTLFRTHPSATVHNPTRIKLMQKFGWSKIAILQQAEEVFISTVEDLENRCKEASIEIVTRQSFLSDPTDAVRNLRRQDARIIVGLFYVVAARRVLCEMYKQQLYGRSYVSFFIGWYEDNWFEQNLQSENISCTRDEMRRAAEGHLTTEAIMWNQNNEKTVSGMSSEDFRIRLNKVLSKTYDIANQRYPEGYQEAPLAYDAVWSVAFAFNKTMERLKAKKKSLKDFTYTDKEIADEIYAAMNSTQFLGVSGWVAFSSQGDRIALTQIEQMVNGTYYKLGYYDTLADNLTWFNKEQWIGGKVPQDRTIVRRVLRTVSLPLFICMSIVSTLGIIVGTALIVFNLWNRHRRVIQQSHPVCNTIMLFGVITCLVSVILLGIDGQFVDPSTYPKICQARAWILSMGFTLAFGAMFSKVWRVHRFTTKAKTDPKKKVEPWKLYTMVSGLLVVDIVILLTWQLQDPLERRLESFPLEDPVSTTDDIKIRPELEHCESVNNSVWLGVIYGFKGLILVFGLFLAYETRSIKVKQINDSRYVGMSIYNIAVLCLITAPVAMVIASQQDASYAFVALAVIFCCFLSMLLIFVPKVIEVLRHPHDKAESRLNNDTGISKEDEERYKKLVLENEELQKLIAQKEEKIRILKQRLAERDQQKGDVQSSSQLQLSQQITMINNGTMGSSNQDREVF